MAALTGVGVGGAVGGLTGELVGMGIPEYEAKRYEGHLQRGGILLSVHRDTSDEIKRAKEIMQRTGAQDISSTGESSVGSDERARGTASGKEILHGVVTKMEFMDPHIYFYLDVKDADGKVVNWAFEGSPPNILYRQGWRKDSIKPGDVITAKGFRARDGAHLVACSTVTFEDGRQLTVGAGNVKGYDKN